MCLVHRQSKKHMQQADSAVTICITPRERFSCAVDSLHDIATNTATTFELVYIDANSPQVIAAQLKDICAQHGFTYLRIQEYLPPNKARNTALARVKTPYVVFIDNDLFVQSGWLEALLNCAQETGAWAVGPVVLEGTGFPQIIHMAGGDLDEEKCGDYNCISQQHRYTKQPLSRLRSKLVREPVGCFEFHCVLVRTDVFPQTLFLDEKFLSHQEHLDLARDIRMAGGEVYFEPASIVRYNNARRFQDYDREFFELRWGREWTEKSLEHMREKWNLDPADPWFERLAGWTGQHRLLYERSHKSWVLQVLPLVVKRSIGTWLREHQLLPTKSAH
ncbi:MAG: glycosyltransferase involved in cell wall biosynthesis [Halieaceae bacterium]|jgi:glycosyltransferase involved in cell wall biosynthesis